MLKKSHEAGRRASAYVRKSFKDGVWFPMFTDVNFGSALTIAAVLSTATYYILGSEACSLTAPLLLASAALIGIYRQKHRFDNGRSRVLYDSTRDPSSNFYNGQTEGMAIAQQAVNETREDVQIIKQEVREEIKRTEQFFREIRSNHSLLPTSSLPTHRSPQKIRKRKRMKNG
jgi:hypothetical protein